MADYSDDDDNLEVYEGDTDNLNDEENTPTLNDLAMLVDNNQKQVTFIARGLSVVCCAISEQAKVFSKAGVSTNVVKLLELVGDVGVLMANKATEMDAGECVFDDQDTRDVFEQAALLRKMLKRRVDIDEQSSSAHKGGPSAKKRRASVPAMSDTQSTSTHTLNASADESVESSPDERSEMTIQSLLGDPASIVPTDDNHVITYGDMVADTSQNYKAIGNMYAYHICNVSGTIVALGNDSQNVNPTRKMLTAAVSDANQKGRLDERIENNETAGKAMAAFCTAILRALLDTSKKPIYIAGACDGEVDASTPLELLRVQAPLWQCLLRLAATKLEIRTKCDPAFVLAACRICIAEMQPYLRQLSVQRGVSPKKKGKQPPKKATKPRKVATPMVDM